MINNQTAFCYNISYLFEQEEDSSGFAIGSGAGGLGGNDASYSRLITVTAWSGAGRSTILNSTISF